mmetsp:Transcript_34446/g.81590  ORF Transcript_34446/g.81590 Transcript_34446/m.81590 type:complete len:244 (+) Transcript_34446:174-905(+)
MEHVRHEADEEDDEVGAHEAEREALADERIRVLPWRLPVLETVDYEEHHVAHHACDDDERALDERAHEVSHCLRDAQDLLHVRLRRLDEEHEEHVGGDQRDHHKETCNDGDASPQGVRVVLLLLRDGVEPLVRPWVLHELPPVRVGLLPLREPPLVLVRELEALPPAVEHDRPHRDERRVEGHEGVVHAPRLPNRHELHYQHEDPRGRRHPEHCHHVPCPCDVHADLLPEILPDVFDRLLEQV